jgi:ABC-type bacteriocin/lantibiotic exporter with double-glycine peptidase domain
MKVNLVQQKKNGCVLACISMMTNIPLDQVYDVYPEFNSEGVNTFDTIKIFNRLGYEPIQYVHPMMFPGRLYMCGVASLNNLGGLHCIVVYVHQNNIFDVYDPVEDGKLRYGNNEGEIKLTTYTDVVELVVE